MTKFQLAKLISKYAWEAFQPMNDASWLEFDKGCVKLMLGRIDECDSEEIKAVLDSDINCHNFAKSYVSAWKFKVDHQKDLT